MTNVVTAKKPDREEARKGGRPAAGTDPQKRRQILEGAEHVFTTLGFDAASMNDVAREAQVSKATLYVYFQDKEHLFTAICAERRDRNIAEMMSLLDAAKPLEATLTTFSIEMLRRISQPYVIAANRIVIGVAERMPEVGREFFEAGPMRLAHAFAEYLDHHVAAGTLEIEDTFLASVQFLELAQATVFRPRLYGVTTLTPTDEDLQRVAHAAVRVFCRAYRSES